MEHDFGKLEKKNCPRKKTYLMRGYDLERFWYIMVLPPRYSQVKWQYSSSCELCKTYDGRI